MNYGFIPKEGKTKKPTYGEVELTIKEDGRKVWMLPEGYYDILLKQGIDMKDRYKGYFKTRSSVIRCNAVVRSGLFDAGFKTEHGGCFLKVENPIEIEYGARVAQFLVTETDVVENLYNGQWQNK